MALTAQQLATASTCFACIPAGYRDAVLIYLLNQLANMATPQQLVDAARCYDCIPQGYKRAVQIYLEDAILAGGGGGGGGVQVFLIADGGAPVIVPDNGAGVAYTVAGDVWTYDNNTNNWNKIISA